METCKDKQNEINAFYNFDREARPLFYDGTFKKIMRFLNKASLDFSKSRYPYYSHELLKDTKAFFNEYFSLIDVLYLPEENLLPLTYAGRENEFNKVNNLLEGIGVYCKSISPYELPINKKGAIPFYGEVDKRLFLYKDEPDLYRIPIIFTGITLGYPYTTISPSVYAHEIAHTQIFSQKDCIKCFDYMEVISIFIEKLSGYTTSLEAFREIERRRCQSLLSSLNKIKNRTINETETMYVISTLIAERLFCEYIYGTDNDKTTIIDTIQDIFDGTRDIDDLLHLVGASFEESKNEYSLAKNLSL